MAITSATDSAPVAVLSYRYWQSHYSAAADAIGRMIQLDGRQHAIIGIMPERFQFLSADIYVPLSEGGGRRTTLLRLRPGVSRAVVASELQTIVRRPVLPEVYVPYTLWTADAVLLLARTSESPSTILDSVKRQISTVNGDQPVMFSSTLEERLWENGWARQQFVAALFSACAALALALAAIGIYSIMSCAVSRRTAEFGLRRALGAPSGRILRDIFQSAIASLALGLTCGLALVAVLHRPIAIWTENSLWNPVSLGLSVLVLTLPQAARSSFRRDVRR